MRSLTARRLHASTVLCAFNKLSVGVNGCRRPLQHVGAALNLAALHHRYGDTRNAIEYYRRAADIIDPGDIDMIVMLR